MKKNLLSLAVAGCMAFSAFAGDPGADPQIMVNPPSGSVLNELSELTLTFNVKVQEDYPGDVQLLKDGATVSGVKISFELAESLMEATVTFTPAVTEQGTYTVKNLDWAYVPSEIPGAVFPELNPTYIIEAQTSNVVTLDPANGSRLSELSQIVITYPIPVKEDWTDAVKVLKNGEEYNGTTLHFGLADDMKTATVTFTPAITEEGYYKIKDLDYAYCGQDGTVFDSMNPEYIVGNPAKPDPIIVCSPADGATVTRLDSFILRFENVDVIECNAEIPAVLTLKGSDDVLCNYTLTYDSYQNEIFLQPNTEDFAVTEPGTYVLVCPEGSFSLDGKPYSYTATFTIADKLTRPAADPAEGEVVADQLKKVTFTFRDTVEIESFTDYMIANVKLQKVESDEEGEYLGKTVATYNVSVSPDAKNVLVLEAKTFDITETGVYSLALPPTLLVTNLGKNEAWAFHYEVTKIDSGIAENAAATNFNVYGIDGTCVMKNATDVNALPRGLYIINGKKVIVK